MGQKTNINIGERIFPRNLPKTAASAPAYWWIVVPTGSTCFPFGFLIGSIVTRHPIAMGPFGPINDCDIFKYELFSAFPGCKSCQTIVVYISKNSLDR